ncbi:MAG: dTMP kinase [Candidatus Thalassarchaeum sp.]|nr:dTMP kinase [Candidatus Thalassarchaeum sp.]MCS5531630.1 dTMP kinase [Candidatus Poseidoniales archaeon]MEC8955006.1 dTMP kinase [Candidatus Thermoplasmatota archaeon]MEC9351446.1 dTMP kinase [Candidatus Thermoplasmatota archaeon]
MYLITIEGGDGSGKGLATKVVAEVLEKEFCFTSVEITGEPRRDHPLGRLAIDSVRQNTHTPEEEAGFFAADRVDHSHGWILPRLEEGRIVVSERNVHSSLVYQGIVGSLGVERVAQINSAALVPDLCIWVDCDPEVAMKRIQSGTLRMMSDKAEYFETTELQNAIRAGYASLLSGEVEMPIPFDMGAIIGPVSNETTEREFRRKLTLHVRKFLHSRPAPLNVDTEAVERFMLKRLIKSTMGQTVLDGLGVEPARTLNDWLDGKTPWRVLREAQEEHTSALQQVSEDERVDVPKSISAHSISAICGTLALLPSADVNELREAQGPVRAVSDSHTHKVLRFLADRSKWVNQHKSLLGRDAARNQLRDESHAFGTLSLVLWPLRKALSKWLAVNPDTHLRFAMGQIVRSGEHPRAVRDTIERLAILGNGRSDTSPPAGASGLVNWWQGN